VNDEEGTAWNEVIAIYFNITTVFPL